MKRSVTSPVIIAVALALSTHASLAQEKIKYGSAVKFSPTYYLPVLAAQELGIFNKRGLDVEWVPARSGPDLMRDFAGGAVQIGSSSGATDVPAIARGVPAVIVANLQSADSFGVWVPSNSAIHTPGDLKGAKLGVSRLNGAEHAYGRLVVERLGVANDVSFTATGGIRESLALFTTGRVDGVVLTPNQMATLQLEGKARELLKVQTYSPQPWLSYTIIAGTEFLAKQPETAKKVVESILEANRFLMSKKGEEWALAKMEKESKYSPEAAKVIYATLSFSPDGKFQPGALKNLTEFMVRYELLNAAELPPLDKLVSDQFVR
jgi:NitT/TauT family transport system substrate-binding protein